MSLAIALILIFLALVVGLILGYLIACASVNSALDRLALGRDDVRPIYSEAFLAAARGRGEHRSRR